MPEPTGPPGARPPRTGPGSASGSETAAVRRLRSMCSTTSEPISRRTDSPSPRAEGRIVSTAADGAAMQGR